MIGELMSQGFQLPDGFLGACIGLVGGGVGLVSLLLGGAAVLFGAGRPGGGRRDLLVDRKRWLVRAKWTPLGPATGVPRSPSSVDPLAGSCLPG